jgi:hypothetical protein
MNEPSPDSHERAQQPGGELLEILADTEKPFLEAAKILEEAGHSSDAEKLRTRAHTLSKKAERTYYTENNITQPVVLYNKDLALDKVSISTPNRLIAGPLPEELINYPTRDYDRSRSSTGGIIHNP